MSCVSPVPIPAPRGYFPPGKLPRPLMVPCGRCLGCSLSRAEAWSLRCIHEARYHDANCFLTLTYRDENLPSSTGDLPSLMPRHVQLFLKRLRKSHGAKLRYLYCGEYGSVTLRPHYHMLVFGYEPADKVLHSVNHRGDRLYTSVSLDSLWGLGSCLVGDLTEASAGYTCRYTIKKQMDGHQFYIDRGQVPPYIQMSRRPGIGAAFYSDFVDDLLKNDTDFIIDSANNKKPIPSYYKKKFRQSHPILSDQLSTNKLHDSFKRPITNYTAKKLILEQKTKNLKRSL